MNEEILIVEDERDTVELLRYNLQREGFRTKTASNGEEAIQSIKRRMPDLILLDIMMPGMNGWEVCRHIRSNDDHTPVVMLTALSSEDERLKGLTIGANDYISKPFSVKELILKVKRHAGKERLIKGLMQKEKEAADTLDYLNHELENSLIAMAGLSKRVLEGSDVDYARYMNSINSTAHYMSNLLRDISIITRFEKGDRLLHTEPVDIYSEVSMAVKSFRNHATSKELAISILNDTQNTVMGDKTAVRQVLTNLISNAIKYNKAKGRVLICFFDTENGVEVAVRDTGCGIPKEERKKIFEKRYRAKGSEHEKGNGLGLYLVKLLTESMGGQIRVVSNELGSTFTLTFKKAKGIAGRINEQE